MSKYKSLDIYEVISLITGFGLLTFELIASRVLAPSIGSTIYVWTSVIGVIIAALSLGYSVGGKIADIRTNKDDLIWLLLAIAGTVAFTSLSFPFFLSDIVGVFGDPRLQGFVASLILYAPTSFVLGIISPYLARLKNSSVKTTGTTIASLSSLNALGSIAGTFLTGFVFLAYLGSKETFVLVSFLFLATSWIINPKKYLKKRIILSILIVLVGLLSIPSIKNSGLVKTIDTSSASYNILDVLYHGIPARVLVTGPGGYQSGEYRNDSKNLVFSYTKKLAEVVEVAPKKDDILILGGGAYTLPEYLADKYPKSNIQVVEIDPELPKISETYFGYKKRVNILNISEDARVFLNKNSKKFDVILVDVFSDSSIPFSLSTIEYASKIKNSLTEDGVVAANVHGSKKDSCSKLVSGIQNSYKREFTHNKLFPLVDSGLEEHQNIILSFSNQNLNYLKQGWQTFDFDKDIEFTDNFAPVEHLKANCTG